MNDLNKAFICGRLGQDPEVRYTRGNTAVATLSVATQKTFKRNNEKVEKAEWHRVVAWGKLAEICDSYMNKGDRVLVEGEIETQKWTDNNGQDRYTTQIKAVSIQNLTPKTSRTGSNGQLHLGNESPIQDRISREKAMETGAAKATGSLAGDDDELPF